jgi:fumarate hydratase class I
MLMSGPVVTYDGGIRPQFGRRATRIMKRSAWENAILDLIRRTSTELPADIVAALTEARKHEQRGSHACWVLNTMDENIELSKAKATPLCQDTGTLIFYFRVPTGFDTNMLASITRSAVSRATRRGYLRQNTVDAITGAAYPTNIAAGAPKIHFAQGARKNVEVKLMMKGGGCENVGVQYSLPDARLGAERDLEGVRLCILDAVVNAQGRGCSPGVLGVCIGGDRATGYEHSKELFLRKLDEPSPNKALAKLEQRTLKEANQLGIGPMGVSGRTTLLGVKIGALSRLPASFFVSISYMCWAYRRRGMMISPAGERVRWLY